MPVASPPKCLEGLTLQTSAPCLEQEINGQERISYMLSIDHANRQGSGFWSLGWLTAQHPVGPETHCFHNTWSSILKFRFWSAWHAAHIEIKGYKHAIWSFVTSTGFWKAVPLPESTSTLRRWLSKAVAFHLPMQRSMKEQISLASYILYNPVPGQPRQWQKELPKALWWSSLV